MHEQQRQTIAYEKEQLQLMAVKVLDAQNEHSQMQQERDKAKLEFVKVSGLDKAKQKVIVGLQGELNTLKA
jgi:hypothetical protein